jgi:hypothetical protein
MLSDGQICRDCAAKLSPFIASTLDLSLDDAGSQILIREENKMRLSSFRPTRTIFATDDESPDEWRIMVDEIGRRFVAFRGRQSDLIDVNPDIFSLDQVRDVEIGVGTLVITLDHPYISELRLAPFYTARSNEVRHALLAERFRDRHEKAAREIADWRQAQLDARQERALEQDGMQVREASRGSRQR